MELALQITLGLFCVPLTLLGLKSMLAPTGMVEDLAIEPQGPAGLNTIRGVVGGLFLSTVAMIALGIGLHNTAYFVSAALLMLVPALGRVIGIGVDGFDSAVVRPLVVEIVIGVVLLTASLTL